MCTARRTFRHPDQFAVAVLASCAERSERSVVGAVFFRQPIAVVPKDQLLFDVQPLAQRSVFVLERPVLVHHPDDVALKSEDLFLRAQDYPPLNERTRVITSFAVSRIPTESGSPPTL